MNLRILPSPLASERVHRSHPGSGGQSLFGQARRFAAIGVVSTVAYVALYALLRPLAPAAASNALALVVTALGNTAANRRLTFGIRDRASLVRDHLAGLVAFGFALLLTTGALTGIGLVGPRAGRMVEVGLLVLANAAATVARFVLLRAWIARPDPAMTAAIAN
jgi:putative flippase GtrA